MYMKTTTLAIIVVLTAMILVTAGAFNSPALAKPSKDSSSSKGSSSTSGGSSSTSGGSSSTSKGSSSVSTQLKSLISCLTSSSKLTGTMPTKAQFATCEAQSNFGTLGGSAIGGSTSGGSTSGGSTSGGSTSGGSTTSSAKTGGGGLVPLTSGVAGPQFLGSK
jgi:hypothetical protein